jgi:hypothetical protein
MRRRANVKDGWEENLLSLSMRWMVQLIDRHGQKTLGDWTWAMSRLGGARDWELCQ